LVAAGLAATAGALFADSESRIPDPGDRRIACDRRRQGRGGRLAGRRVCRGFDGSLERRTLRPNSTADHDATQENDDRDDRRGHEEEDELFAV
jgi:hypothetical protein